MKKYLFAFLIFVINIISFSGCFDTPKEPVMPNWDVDLNIPVTDRTYKLSEIIDTSNNIRIGNHEIYGDSIYFFAVEDIDTSIAIADSFSIPVASQPQNANIKGPAVFGGGAVGIVYNPSPDYHVDSAEFKSGKFIISINNNDSNPIDYEIVLPGFKSKNDNSILRAAGTINAGRNSRIELNIANYIYDELPIGISDIQNYKFQGQPGFFIVLKAKTNSVVIDLQASITNEPLYVSRMVGSFARTDLGMQTVKVKTNFGEDINDFADRINFKSINLQLQFETKGQLSNITIEDSLVLIGYREGKNPITLNYKGNDYIKINLEVGKKLDPLIINETNSTNIIDFIKELPERIEVRNRTSIYETSSSQNARIASNDSIGFDININAPLVISAQNASLEDTINIGEELSQEDRDDITKANNASLVLEVENGIPLGVTARAIFVDKNYNRLFTIRSTKNNVIQDSLTLAPASVNANGVPVNPSVNRLHLLLNKDEIEKFKSAEYIIAEIRINSASYPQFVPIRARDAVKFKIFGGVNYHVDPEDL